MRWRAWKERRKGGRRDGKKDEKKGRKEGFLGTPPGQHARTPKPGFQLRSILMGWHSGVLEITVCNPNDKA